MNFLTDFADQAVVLPLAGAVLASLVALGWRRGAAAWGGCVAGVLAVMLVLKLTAMACATHLAWSGIDSPSGHTATATMVYGGLFVLLTPRAAAIQAAIAVAFVIGLTRLALHVHTVADVVLGGAIGLAGVALLSRLVGPRPPCLRAPWLLVPVCIVMLVFHGDRLQAEAGIRWFALDIWPFSVCR